MTRIKSRKLLKNKIFFINNYLLIILLTIYDSLLCGRNYFHIIDFHSIIEFYSLIF